MNISKFLNDPSFRKIISVILGLGFAIMIGKISCKGDNCRIIKGPKISETKDYVYKIDDSCFSYTPVATRCPES